MSTDLDTLLRDAGREPTIDLDADAVHARGRRRTVLRRTSVAAASALAMGAVVLGGVAVLSPSTPDLEVTDQPEQSGTTSTSGTTPESVDELLRRGADQGSVTLDVDAADVAAITDSDIAALQWRQSDAVFDVTRFLAGGGRSTWEVATGTPAGPVVANDASVWWLSDDGTLRRAAPQDGTITDVLGPDGDYGWVPVGTVADSDQVIVALSPVTDQSAERRNVLGLVAPDGTFSDLPIDGGPDVFATGPIVDAHSAREAVVLAVATSDARLVFGARFGDALSLIAELPRHDVRAGTSFIAGVGIVGDEIWVVEPALPMGEGMSVRAYPLDGGAEEHTTFEVPTILAEGRWPTGLSVSPSGEVVLLRTSDTTTFEPGTLAVFPGAPDGDPWRAVRTLDTPGILSAIRPEPEDTPDPARCATGPYAQELDSQAVDAVWFPCQGTGGDDRLISFFPVERLSGVDFADEEARLEAYLGALFDGPTDAEQALGLEPVVSSDVASLAGVVVDGAAVTVDLAPGEQVGVLGTSHAGTVFATAVAAAVLQFTAYDRVTITLDGSCQAWVALGDADGCTVLDQGQTPWSTLTEQ